MYFAPGVGLVKITFRHADGSTSTVETDVADAARPWRWPRSSRRVVAAPAAAQIQPPTLTADTTFAFQGVSQYDFSAGVQEDVGLAAAVDDARGRTYAAG